MLARRRTSTNMRRSMLKQHHRRGRCCGLTTRDLCTFFGSLFLPMMLGVFTMIITFDQRKEARDQRMIDRQEAELQREQDLNISRDQREVDKTIAENRRLTDELNGEKARNMSLEQRIHELAVERERYEKLQEQRDEDVQMLNLQRDQDKLLAQQQRDHDRMLSDQKQKAEMDLQQHRYEQERAQYLDALLLSHINELGQLLKENNGSLTANSTIHGLARAKTLNIIKQIGSNRSTQLILFLHDTGQLRDERNPLDLSGAQLNGIDLSLSAVRRPIIRLSLADTYLNNASFVGTDISYWNFSGTHLSRANFARCRGMGVSFNEAVMIETDFSYANFFSMYFDGDMTKANFHNATIASTYFDKVTMVGANFSYAKLKNAKFVQTNLTEATFDHAIFESLNFQQSNLNRVDFSFANMDDVKVASFRDLNLKETIFRGVNLDFFTFTYCDLTSADMREATIIRTNFYGCTLAYATLVNCNIYFTVFSYSNLSHANMTGVIHLREQLNNALSIYDTILPNGTRGLEKSPFMRIVARCNASIDEDWYTMESKIVLQYFEEKCVFAPSSNSTVTQIMKRNFTLDQYYTMIKDQRAMIVVQARMGSYTIMVVRQLDNTFKLLREDTYSVDMPLEQIELHPQIKVLEVLIKFFIASSGVNLSWLEFIDLNIDIRFETS
jgi:uncharacterized protein YjbI with pentapeptide repeats